MEKHRAHRRRKALATSFVITIGTAAAGTVAEGCKKQGVDGHESNRTSLRRQSNDGECYLDQHISCPKNVSCNPPPPMRVDCPPELRDAGDPPAVTRRPPGKEQWLRVPAELWFLGKECQYRPEYFCPMPPASGACTTPELVKVGCRNDPDAGARTIDAFAYKDGLGVCRKVAAGPCTIGRRGDCLPPEGDPVPCP
jgi:hypothetical protein